MQNICRVFFPLFTFQTIFIALSYSRASAEFITESIVENLSFEIQEVATSNGKVVWVASDGNDDEIYHWDGASITQLSDNYIDDSSPSFDGSNVVWIQHDDSSPSQYFLKYWNGSIVTDIPLASNNSIQSVSCENGACAWDQRFESGSYDNIWYYNGFSSAAITSYTIDDQSQLHNVLIDQNIVYYRYNGSDDNIDGIYRKGIGPPVRIFDHNLYFDVSNGILTLHDPDSNYAVISIENNVRTQISTPTDKDLLRPYISNNKIGWAEEHGALVNFWHHDGLSATMIAIEDQAGDSDVYHYDSGNFVWASNFGYNLKVATEITPDPPGPTSEPGGDRVVYGEVALDGSASVTPNEPITQWHWSLVDRHSDLNNRVADGETATVTGLARGFYDVTLTVTDNLGLTAAKSFQLVALGPWDVNSDGQTGLAETIFILKELTGGH